MSAREKLRIGIIVLLAGIGLACLVVVITLGGFTPFLTIGALALILLAVIATVDLLREHHRRHPGP